MPRLPAVHGSSSGRRTCRPDRGDGFVPFPLDRRARQANLAVLLFVASECLYLSVRSHGTTASLVRAYLRLALLFDPDRIPAARVVDGRRTLKQWVDRGGLSAGGVKDRRPPPREWVRLGPHAVQGVPNEGRAVVERVLDDLHLAIAVEAVTRPPPETIRRRL